MVREVQLHAFWKNHAKAIGRFKTTDGRSIDIYEEGVYNQNQGPDFLNACLYVDGLRWFGNIEFHVKTSDWFQHKHHHDLYFKPVILHVVWNHDSSRYNHSPIIELQSILSISHLQQYNSNVFNLSLACSRHFQTTTSFYNYVYDFSKNRLEVRSQGLINLLNKYKCWEVICWIRVCAILGGVQNSEAFNKLAESIPYAVIRIVKFDLNALLAIMLGQSGFLYSKFIDGENYLFELYLQLASKFGLVPPKLHFVFLRMRPNVFPKKRIRYLANLIFTDPQWFEKLAQIESRSDCKTFFDNSKFKLPKAIQTSIIINLIIPMCLAKKLSKDKNSTSVSYLTWMDSIPAENNVVVKRFNEIGISVDSAKHSQGLLELFRRKCEKSWCNACPRSINLAS